MKTLAEILQDVAVIPVVTVDDAADAAPLGKALRDGGLPVVELTLRTPAALEAIRRMRVDVAGLVVGAGTVTTIDDMRAVRDAGAAFAVSPGYLPELADAAQAMLFPYLPGVATASEVMMAKNAGFDILKFYPAEAAGGRAMLAALAGPFPDLKFCPTGGLTEQSFVDYIRMTNVECVGGGWIAPGEAIREKRWDDIRETARTTVKIVTEI